MKKAYNEIMERVKVTGGMRDRILNNLELIDVDEPPKRILRFPAYKKYLSIAACVAVLLLGIVALPDLREGGPGQPPVDLENPGFNIVELTSIEELSEAVGFEVAEVDALPFEATNITYTAYGQDLAEITYSGDSQTAVFRKSMGSEDNSGDFNVYDDIKEIMIDARTVSLKGISSEYTLAVWSNNGFSYSLQLASGISEAKWKEVISTVD